MIRDLQRQDCIAALATAVEGAVAILRVSGPGSRGLRDRVFRPGRSGAWRNAQLRLGDVVDPATEEPLDQALAAWFEAGRSYTGEPTLELHIHGGAANCRRVLDVVLRSGARMAEPGEFSFRAFASGRMDLSQAEAVQQIVSARAQAELSLAQRALRGSAMQALEPLVRGLIQVLASVEARLDFPEDVEPAERVQLRAEMQELRHETERLVQGHQAARRRCELARVVLLGPANVGKSTLFNLLCGRQRAITHARPGTTRDPLEAQALIADRDLLLIDTAGLRETQDPVEQIAVQKSQGLGDAADLRLWVFDVSLPPPGDLLPAGDDELRVLNKCDLGVDPAWHGQPGLRLSARSGAGVQDLKRMIAERSEALDAELHDTWPVLLQRHVDLLQLCLQGLDDAAELFDKDLGDELVATQLRRALTAVQQILGRDLSESVLQTLFDQFCVGK